jgi:tRNA modification GTPase
LDILDTITAIATGPGEGGIGIIRVSGPEALKVASRLFTPEGGKECEFKVRHFYYGELRSPESGTVLDNVNLVYMRAPHSYTGEDVVEIHSHGGALIMRNVLAAVISEGARMAEPGEFTRQAFVNGKMDLTEAEAVLDLIRAGTESALISARGRIEGRLTGRLKEIRDPLFTLLAQIEAELDFSEEEEVEKLPAEEVIRRVEETEASLKKLLSTYDEGSALRDGVKVVILGRPNVGKSSLLNLILKEERAIVTAEPGTTRDVIEEIVNIRGLPVRLMDTAGLRKAEDKAEAIGVERARERAAGARLVLFVVDGSDKAAFEKDFEILDAIQQKIIIVANKSDLIEDKERDGVASAFKDHNENAPVFISAKKEEGLAELEERIYEAAVGHALLKDGDSIEGCQILIDTLGETITSARHKGALEEAVKGLERVLSIERESLPMELVALELRSSLDRIGEITGETTTDDILDYIFSEFCIGK